jgi:hypothetical protein
MYRVLKILYWLLAIMLIATIVTSLGYRFGEAVLIGTMFVPGSVVAKYFYQSVSFSDRKSIISSVFVTVGIIVMELLLLFLGHFFIEVLNNGGWDYSFRMEFPKVLMNPVFITILVLVLSVFNIHWEKWLRVKFPESAGRITFLSDRHNVTLSVKDILYVESNDTITMIVTCDGSHYRNKTPISRWESILSPDFIRIHRSYLVQKDEIKSVDGDLLHVGDIELPVSKKYKSSVCSYGNKQ